jgi:putative transposase
MVAGRPRVSHVRGVHDPREPVHVTMKVVKGIESLRGFDMCTAVFKCFRDRTKKAQARCRVVHFSIQRDHLHLIVEADHGKALSRGIQGLAVSIAKNVNRRLGRRGRVFAERFHSRALSTPLEVRNCIVYVLRNSAKHGEAQRRDGLDMASSAVWADVWVTPPAETDKASPVHPPKVWLLKTGWRKHHGAIGRHEVPRSG